MALETLRDFELADVHRFGLLDWTETGMHFLAVLVRKNGMSAIGKADKFVSGRGRHAFISTGELAKGESFRSVSLLSVLVARFENRAGLSDQFH
jgi:hypothetical protein